MYKCVISQHKQIYVDIFLMPAQEIPVTLVVFTVVSIPLSQLSTHSLGSDIW